MNHRAPIQRLGALAILAIVPVPSLCAWPCQLPPEPPAHVNAGADALEARFDQIVPALLKHKGVPAVSIAVVQRGSIALSKAYGNADRLKKTPATVRTRFQIASVSKPLAAWGVMALRDQGRVELDAPAGRYLKRWQLPKGDFDNDKVTVRRLLSHTSGLSIYPSEDNPLDGKLPPLEEALTRPRGEFGKLRVVQEPGTAFQYNNGNYAVLQLLVEEVTGEPFAAYMRRTVLGPLGMKESGYEWSAELRAVVATPHREDGTAFPQLQYTNQEASGGLYATASDLARFVAASMPGADKASAGRGVLKPATVRLMLAPADHTDGMYALGYKTMPVSKDVRLMSHDGANPGWRAVFMLHEPTGNGLVILTNSGVGGRIVAPIVLAWAEWAGIDLSPLNKPAQR